ncbi:MAG: hypothetical protein LC105_12745 [Chitinophagales bacterium]|nr:hypothetical protein [Chitinophagales bacterium]MCZ2394722.1 hypothetical protein [Chitinophagales bacterium]
MTLSLLLSFLLGLFTNTTTPINQNDIVNQQAQNAKIITDDTGTIRP